MVHEAMDRISQEIMFCTKLDQFMGKSKVATKLFTRSKVLIHASN